MSTTPEQKLLLAQKRFGNLIRAIPVGVIMVNPDGIIEAVNPAIVKMFGYSERELAGLDFRMLLQTVPWADEAELLAWHNSNPEKAIELRGVKKSGGSLPVDVSVSQLDNESRRQLLLIMMQDVSERVKIEKMKQEFFDMVSHDMRTPLCSISLLVDMLQENASDLPDDTREEIKKIGNNSKHVTRLINDLLDIEKVEAGEIKLIYGLFSLSEMIMNAIDVVQAQATKRKVNLVAASSELIVCADQDRVLRVLINLISNAIKFSPKGGKIEISFVDQPDETIVSVKDEGRGIPTNMQELVFERFKQVEAADATSKGGSGLGLAICKGFIEAHGGRIGVESAVGQGSKFWFSIPHRDISEFAAEQSGANAEE
jgi:PAS domain S-box-containing protein